MIDLTYYHVYRELRKMAHEDTVTLVCALRFIYDLSEEESLEIVKLITRGEAFDIGIFIKSSRKKRLQN